MFSDTMIKISFQIIFLLILTIGIKKGLNCSGVIYFLGYMRMGLKKELNNAG